MPFAPNGLVALTTDFGGREPFVGIVKARILSRFPAARCIDLSHGIPAGRPDLAGFWLGRAWHEFPAGTVHLAVVDPGVGTARGVVLAETGGQLLLAPDNGLLPEALRARDAVDWRAMDPALPARLALGELSQTFHGRDLFAPLAALLAAGELASDDFGPRAAPADPEPLPRATAAATPGASYIAGRVLLADHFGNLCTNIDGALLGDYRQPVVEVAGKNLPLLATYGEAPEGAPLALINAFGLVEIALNGASAAGALGLDEGAPVTVRDGVRA